MNRIISLSVEDIYIKYTGEAFGATGSHNAMTLRIAFGSAWDGTAKTAYFTDALGSASVSVILGLDTLVDGAYYEVDVPSEALKYAGEATVTIKGVLTSGDTTTKAITTAAGHFRVLDSELPESAGNAGTITASDKEQLQAEIAGLENLFTTTKAAAETAAANAKSSEEAAADSATAAEASKTAAAGSAATAAEKATAASDSASKAEASQTAAKSSEDKAKASEAAVEAIAAGIVTEEAARQAAEQERVSAEEARQTAETVRDSAESERRNAESGRVTAEGNRASAEESRVTAEQERTSAESTRVSNEATRQTAEAARDSAEADRVQEEEHRENEETFRKGREAARQTAESARQTAETARETAETARNVWEDYDNTKAYVLGNKVYWEGSSYVCKQPCTGITPANSDYWQLVVRSGFTEDSAFGFDVVDDRLICYYSGDNPPPFRLGDDGHLYVDLDQPYDLGLVSSAVAKIYAKADTQGNLMAYRDQECTVAADTQDAAHLSDGSDIQLIYGTKIYRLSGTSASPLRGYFSRMDVTGGGDAALVLRADYAAWSPEEYAAGTVTAPIAMKRYQAEVMPAVGDVNGDGLVDKIDAYMIRAYTRSELTLSEAAIARADYNGDGLVNARDTMAIMEKVNSETE